MPDPSNVANPSLVRCPTDVPGLDTIMRGGFFVGDVYLVEGGPGTGKTVLGNQLCFNHVSRGGRAAYVTLLAETHARMIEHVRSLAFFNPDVVGNRLQYLSGYGALDRNGLDGLRDLLAHLLREERISLLVVDGLVAVAESASSPLAFRRFVLELHALTEMVGCTAVLMTAFPEECRPAAGIVDGILRLSEETLGPRAGRQIQILKFRGSGRLPGIHLFSIDESGIAVYPRTETLFGLSPPPAVESTRRMGFGMPRFDAMMDGGPIAASSTLLFGTPGSGKTSIALSFLVEGAKRDDPGLYFGFDESPARLIDKSKGLGQSLAKWTASGAIELVWNPPNTTKSLDQLAEELLTTIHQRRIRRLVVDNLNSFELLPLYPERFSRFLTALTNELRTLDVTALMTVETAHFLSPMVDIPIKGVSSTVDNIIFLRSVELRSQLHHLISILKMRRSTYDPKITELIFGSYGVDAGEPFENVQAVLTGVALPTAGQSSVGRPRRRRPPK